MFDRIRAAWRALFKSSTALAPVEDEAPQRRGISMAAIWEAGRHSGSVAYLPEQTFARPTPLPGVLPAGMAMDSALPGTADLSAYASEQAYHEGLGFLGYPYLAELSQRAEYRHVASIWAEHCTRKWIKLSGDDAKVKEIEAELQRLAVRELFREAIEKECFFGRIQLFMDFGDFDKPAELGVPLVMDNRKINAKRPLQRLAVVEPMWSYPGPYDAQNPLAPDFYKPSTWYLSGRTIHASRMLTMVGRPMPNMLKPAYAFGGVALTQICKPYVDNWLRTRQSVSDLIHSFSVMVLKTDMEDVLGGGSGDQMFMRVDMFNRTRDNRGTFVVDKNMEDFTNVSAPVAGLDKLQAQAIEQIASVSGIPLVILLGITPSGLNACLTGDTKVLTDRGHVPISEVTTADLVMTRRGFAPIRFAGVTKRAKELYEIRTESATIRCTGNHPIWVTSTNGFVPAENVRVGDPLLSIGGRPGAPRMHRPWSGADNGGGSGATATSLHGMRLQSDRFFSIAQFGKRIADQFRTISTSTISTAIGRIISSITLSRCTSSIMPSTMVLTGPSAVEPVAANQSFAFNVDRRSQSQNFRAERNSALGRVFSLTGATIAPPWQSLLRSVCAKFAQSPSSQNGRTQNSALGNARQPAKTAVITIEPTTRSTRKNFRDGVGRNDAQKFAAYHGPVLGAGQSSCLSDGTANNTAHSSARIAQDNGVIENVISIRKVAADEFVYDITVEDGHLPEFFAEGILVHNSSEGEIRVFYDKIMAYLEKVCGPELHTLLQVIQLSLFGDIDPKITFEFESLWEMSDKDKADIRKADAEADGIYIDKGVIDPDESRARLNDEEGGMYAGALSGPAPGVPEDGGDDDLSLAGDAAPCRAAGVMCVVPDGRMLFLRRADNAKSHPGTWCFPGGSIDAGEDEYEAACREMLEETGHDLDTPLGLPVTEHAGFATFRADVPDPVPVALNDEHVAYVWAKPEHAPEPLHPGVRYTLDTMR